VIFSPFWNCENVEATSKEFSGLYLQEIQARPRTTCPAQLHKSGRLNQSAFLRLDNFRVPIRGDFAELFEDGFEFFDDSLGEHVEIGKIIGFFEAFVSEPEDIKAGFVPVEKPACSLYPSPLSILPLSLFMQ
jgi:hypothetical protein